MPDSPSRSELENDLERLFPEPEAGFVARLEQQAVRQAEAHRAPAVRHARPFGPARGWAAAAGLAALVLALLAAAGPGNVVAAVQKLIGYIPGIGFVEDPAPTLRVLAAPVSVEREGVTLTVEKALAGADSTEVRVRVDGLPRDKSLFAPGWGEQSVHPALRLADGQTLVSSGSFSGAGDFVWAEYHFPPLPAEVETVTLLLERLPGLNAGVAPEGWQVELPLRAAQPGDGLVIASQEPRTSPTVAGARLALESIAPTGGQTALKLRLSSDDPLRRPGVEWWQGLVLLDDAGQELPLSYERPLEGLRDGSAVLLAPALEPGRRYRLRLDQVQFEYRFDMLERAPSVRLPLPADAQNGQAWALDETVQAGGFPLHITAAALLPGEAQGWALRLTIDPQPGLVGVGLRCQDLEQCSSSGFELAEPGRPLTSYLYLDQLPGRGLRLQPDVLLESAQGPWELEFEVQP